MMLCISRGGRGGGFGVLGLFRPMEKIQYVDVSKSSLGLRRGKEGKK